MKETKELLSALTDTAAQGVASFSDGFQFSDIPDFVDEALSWPQAIKGLEAMKGEAIKTNPLAIEGMFDEQLSKLLDAGLNPMLAGTIITNMKGIYYTYATIVQSGGEIIVTTTKTISNEAT